MDFITYTTRWHFEKNIYIKKIKEERTSFKSVFKNSKLRDQYLSLDKCPPPTPTHKKNLRKKRFNSVCVKSVSLTAATASIGVANQTSGVRVKRSLARHFEFVSLPDLNGKGGLWGIGLMEDFWMHYNGIISKLGRNAWIRNNMTSFLLSNLL